MLKSEKLRRLTKSLKSTAVCGGIAFFISYHIKQTCVSISKIVNLNVLDREKIQAEYIYVDDPLYDKTLKIERDKEMKKYVFFGRVWKNLKYSLAWKLLWICRYGSKEQRNNALNQLAAFKNSKIWDCHKLAQALDKNTAVLLARTYGADLRFFLPPPIHVRRAALVSSDLLSYKLRDLVVDIDEIHPHYCIQHFVSKYFISPPEHDIEPPEADCIPAKPDSISERNLCIQCLEALYHHIQLFHVSNYEDNHSVKKLVNNGLMPLLAEAMLRNRDDPDFDLAVLKVLTVLSVHTNLLEEFYQNGMIAELSRLIRSKDIQLASSAAVCLANLSGEHCYKPGLYLLHPLYRTTQPPSCDTLLVHGLRGGVFVTWRQRDRSWTKPLGIIDVTMSLTPCSTAPCPIVQPQPIPHKEKSSYIDTDFQQVVEDLIRCDHESTLNDLEVVLHDLPVYSLREPPSNEIFTAKQKYAALMQEEEDKADYTLCWPKDWLPRDCSNLRILGLNYWSSLSDWLERCPLQNADIETRASDMVPALIDAGVGSKDTPVVWLAHSMGGLIVKQALVEAARSSDKQQKQLSENTKAVLFFSTPHKGSSLANMPRAAAAVLWPSSDVRQLQENSPTLLELHKSFIEYVNLYKWETISFAESLPTLVSAFKVPVHLVKSQSADLGSGVFYQLPLDHLTICKPATRQSVLYLTVLDVLKRATSSEMKIENVSIQVIVENTLHLIKSKTEDIMAMINKRYS